MRALTIFILMISTVVLYPFSALPGDIVVKLATQREGYLLSAAGEPFVRCAMEKTNIPFEIAKVPWERAQ